MVARCLLALLLALTAVPAQDLVSQAELRAGDLQAIWRAERGLNLRYRGADAFLFIPEEFVVHNSGWKVMPFASSWRQAPARLTRADGGQRLTIRDGGAGFDYTKTISLIGQDTVRVEYEYGQTGHADYHLALGYRPAVPWLEGAEHAVAVGDKVDRGRMTFGRAERRVLWTSRDYRFASLFGAWRLRTTRALTLYDDRHQGQFFLGWDQPLVSGQRYRETIEITFEPATATAAGVSAGNLTWARNAELGSTGIAVDLARQAEGPARVALRLEALAGDQVVARAEQQPALSTTPARVELRLRLKEPGDYTLRLAIAPAGGGADLWRATGLPVKAAPFLRFVPGRSLYTSEATGELLLTLARGTKLERLSAEIIADGLAPRTVRPTALETALPFNLAGLANGTHAARCTLRLGDEVVAVAETHFLKAPPRPHEVKVDHRTRGLIVDGKPYFPFGFYTNQGQWNDQRDRTEILRLEAPHKFNLICNYMDIENKVRQPKRTAFQAWGDACDAVGLKMHYDLRSITDLPATPDVQALLTEEIAAYRDLPSLLCWYLADEPDGSGRSPDRYEAHHRAIEQLDPYHPTSMVFCVPPKAASYAKGMDIMMVDPYPIPNQAVTAVSDTVDLVGEAVNWTMPIWCVPQAFGGGEWWGREPTWQEQRCMTWLAIAHGATGIQYFIRMEPHERPFGEAMWAECRKLAGEVRELTPVLLSSEPAPEVAATPPVPWLHLTARAYDGAVYILAVNTDPQPKALSLRCAAPPLGATAQVLFENRSVPVSADGTLQDLIEGLGVRWYTWRTAPEKPNRVVLAEGNLVRNGGFEAQVVTGIPDAFSVSGRIQNGASWGTDPQEAIEGRHALYIRCPQDGRPWDRVSPGVNCYPMELKPGRYRASLYLKADRDGGGANFGLYGFNKSPWKDVSVGREWRQESVEFEVPKDTRWTHFRVTATKRETLWVDALEVRPVP